MDHRTRAEQIRSEVDHALAGTGVVVEDVSVQAAGRRRVVRVTVARDVTDLLSDPTTPLPPLSLDEVAAASRTVDDVLETGDLMGPAAYTLEVSSPGVDTPLTSPSQFRRNVGRLVNLVLADGGTTEGRILSADADGIRLSADPGSPLTYDGITRATVQVEFTRHDAEEEN
jgi:ribosome maturation factor RimP